MSLPSQSSVEFVGPFASHDVIVDGVRVPHLQAQPLDGGKVQLVCDRATGITLPIAQAEQVARFVAFAMRVAERGSGWPQVHNVMGASTKPPRDPTDTSRT